jgi:hypothetical protein
MNISVAELFGYDPLTYTKTVLEPMQRKRSFKQQTH